MFLEKMNNGKSNLITCSFLNGLDCLSLGVFKSSKYIALVDTSINLILIKANLHEHNKRV